ncbi:transcription factor HES-5-like [Denticeps clupeoides]|uniref:Transcription factor HES-5 n=1 Tax=Denticeps clupeoides TaxID=299321 RepID=A0AAY4C2M7_9TELE|nr:transcription factor HES-5-like [Denticeps clupeoides]
MAPTFTADFASSNISKDIHKLRKPVVEKMRRDRINTCIEQLKTMLEKEFHKQDPNTKLEKADILEMTVIYLKQQLQSQLPGGGSSQSWRSPLSAESSLQHRRSVQTASRDAFPPSPAKQSQLPVKQGLQKPVWRPW